MMRLVFPIRGPSLVLPIFFLTSAVRAQQIPPSIDAFDSPTTDVEAQSAASRASRVVKMSPFIVQPSSNDVGYYAENTLAGSRLNTKVSDLGASITIVTRQQMLDTATVNLNDVFLYEANTEGAATYATTGLSDGGRVDNNATVPGTANRVRGVGSPDIAHDYYPSINPTIGLFTFDVYNTETVDILRGPNSLLFGLGSPAGIVNQSTTKAVLGRTFGEVSLRYGSEASRRGSFRLNQAAGDKLAVTVAGVYDSPEYEQKPSYNITRRIYATMTYAPTKTTTIRASYENYNHADRMPSSITASDLITPYRQAGSPTWDPLTLTATVNGVAEVVAAGPNAVNGLSTTRANPNYPALYYAPNGSQTPALWMVQSLNTAAQPLGATANTPYVLAGVGSTITKNPGTMPLFSVPGVSSKAIYDWDRININASNPSTSKADVYNIEVHQQLFRHLFADFGWYREDFGGFRAARTGNLLEIDPNLHLLDGSPNPFFGAPLFVNNTGVDAHQFIQNNNWRVNLAYVLDFTRQRNWLRWLGHHNLAAFGTKRDLQTTNIQYLLTVTDPHAWMNPSDLFASTSVGRNIQTRTYLGGGNGVITSAPPLKTFVPMNVPLRYAIYSNGTYNWRNEAAVEGPEPLGPNSGRSQQTTNSLTLAAQDYLWNDRIVATLGFRRDEVLSHNNLALVTNPATGIVDLSNLRRYGPVQKVFGNTRTAGVVVKPLAWLSFSYDQSRNFNPAPLKYDLFSKALPIPSGRGKDFGVRLDILKGKLYASLDVFHASSDKARGGPANPSIQRIAQSFDTVFLDRFVRPIVTNQLGAGATPDQINAAVLAMEHYPNNTPPPSVTTLDSTSTIDAHGLEGQLIYNPVPNWNFKATIGRQVTTYSQLSPEYDAWVSQRLPIWMSIKDPATGISFWDSFLSTAYPHESDWFAQNVDSYAKLVRALEGKRTPDQRPWDGALISTYRITDGPFKNLRLGGGARYIDKAIIGYLGAPPDASGVVRSLDVNKPVYGHWRYAIDCWASYSFHLAWAPARVQTMLQLNVRDLFQKEGIDAIAINPDGTPSVFRIRVPRQWYLSLTNTF